MKPAENPRNLCVLRVDDGLLHSELGERMDEPYRYIDLCPPASPSEHIGDVIGWESAIRFWLRPSIPQFDLLTGDVDFELDSTTPLKDGSNFGWEDVHIPTGLSHLKPLAAFCLARGTPIGIGIATKNPNYWRNAWNHPQRHVMGALAAHEIGELAAILGDDLIGKDMHETVSRCWEWLDKKHHKATDFRPALKQALTHYRKRLLEMCMVHEHAPKIIVPPKEWRFLADWIQRQIAKPEPVPANLGLTVVYENGQRDCIRLLSLFADSELLDRVACPSEVYAQTTEGPNDAPDLPACELHDKRPQIGRFIVALGALTRTFDTAAQIVWKFPDSQNLQDSSGLQGNLSDVTAHIQNKELIAGLVVLFQVLRWEKSRLEYFQEDCQTQGWCPRKQRLDRQSSSPCLMETLKSLLRLTRGESEPFFRDDVLEGKHWPEQRDQIEKIDFDKKWVKWHFDCLVSMGYLERLTCNEGEQYQLKNGSAKQRLVFLPTRLRPDFLFSPLPAEFTEVLTLRQFLKGTLGYSDIDDNVIPRKIAAAFCCTNSPQDGRNFLDQILTEAGPPWLLELLRQFAEEHLAWRDANTWPHWLLPTI